MAVVATPPLGKRSCREENTTDALFASPAEVKTSGKVSATELEESTQVKKSVESSQAKKSVEFKSSTEASPTELDEIKMSVASKTSGEQSVAELEEAENKDKKSSTAVVPGLEVYGSQTRKTTPPHKGTPEALAKFNPLSSEELTFLINLDIEKVTATEFEVEAAMVTASKSKTDDAKSLAPSSTTVPSPSLTKTTYHSCQETDPRVLLDDIARELRERKAVKSDDAGIPEYLWEEHLVDDGDRVWGNEDRLKLP